MSTIFSPSACSWKPSNPQGKCFSHSKRKNTIEKDELITSSSDYSQRRSISPLQWELLVAHIHLFTLAFFKEVSCLRYLEIPMQFLYKELLGAPHQLTDLHGSVCNTVEVFHLPGSRSFFSEKFDRSVVIWLGGIHPICDDKETARQGRDSKYFAKHKMSQSN